MCVNINGKLLFLTVLAITQTLSNADSPIVETTHGKVKGKSLKTFLKQTEYYGFLGIPYAAPPVKDLRFLDPQPIEPWEDVLVATKLKKPCTQNNINILKGQPLGSYGVEDCLYLDIFTPKIDTQLRPVIVFVYNLQFSCSYNKTKDYSPDFFIEEDVVVATLDHRLSTLGFLSLEDDVVPGNQGLKDIVAALQWIKNNAARFGGNPEKITLMGSRGGAAAVDLLLHSSAKHMFNAAILQGGTSWSSMYLQEDVRERAFKLGEILERAASNNIKLLKELRDLPAPDLLAKEMQAAPADYFKETQRGIITFAPIVEKGPNGLVTDYPENSQEKIDIPIMIGYNSREGFEASFTYLEEPRFLSFLQKDFPFYLPVRTNFKFDPAKDICYEAVDEVKGHYYKKGKVTIKSLSEHITYLGDIITVYPVHYTAREYAKRTSNSVYYYHFDYYSDLNENKNNIMKFSTVEDGTWGAASGDELCYLFYCPDLKDAYTKYNKSMSQDMKILKKMVKMWTNFAKYGDPTPEDDSTLEGLKWPSYDLDSKIYLNIGKQIEVKANLYKEKFEFWDNFIRKWEQRAVNGLISEDNIKDEL